MSHPKISRCSVGSTYTLECVYSAVALSLSPLVRVYVDVCTFVGQRDGNSWIVRRGEPNHMDEPAIWGCLLVLGVYSARSDRRSAERSTGTCTISHHHHTSTPIGTCSVCASSTQRPNCYSSFCSCCCCCCSCCCCFCCRCCVLAENRCGSVCEGRESPAATLPRGSARSASRRSTECRGAVWFGFVVGGSFCWGRALDTYLRLAVALLDVADCLSGLRSVSRRGSMILQVGVFSGSSVRCDTSFRNSVRLTERKQVESQQRRDLLKH